MPLPTSFVYNSDHFSFEIAEDIPVPTIDRAGLAQWLTEYDADANNKSIGTRSINGTLYPLRFGRPQTLAAPDGGSTHDYRADALYGPTQLEPGKDYAVIDLSAENYSRFQSTLRHGDNLFPSFAAVRHTLFMPNWPGLIPRPQYSDTDAYCLHGPLLDGESIQFQFRFSSSFYAPRIDNLWLVKRRLNASIYGIVDGVAVPANMSVDEALEGRFPWCTDWSFASGGMRGLHATPWAGDNGFDGPFLPHLGMPTVRGDALARTVSLSLDHQMRQIPLYLQGRWEMDLGGFLWGGTNSSTSGSWLWPHANVQTDANLKANIVKAFEGEYFFIYQREGDPTWYRTPIVVILITGSISAPPAPPSTPPDETDVGNPEDMPVTDEDYPAVNPGGGGGGGGGGDGGGGSGSSPDDGDDGNDVDPDELDGPVREYGWARDTPYLNLKTTSKYMVRMRVMPHNQRHNATYRIFVRMDYDNFADTGPGGDAFNTSCVMCELGLWQDQGQNISWVRVTEIIPNSSGVGVPTVLFESSGSGIRTETQPQIGDFEVIVDGTNLKVKWLGVQRCSVTLDDGTGYPVEYPIPTDHNIGFGFKSRRYKIPDIIFIEVIYSSSLHTSNSRTVVVASGSGGRIYRDTGFGTLEQSADTDTVSDDERVMSAEFLQKLYIADYPETIRAGTDGVLSSSGTVLSAASVSSWTSSPGVSTVIHMVEISNGAVGVNNGTYEIASVSAGNITLAGAGAGADGTCHFRVMRCPKIYDPKTDALTKWVPTAGFIPLGCRLIAQYRGRLVLAGDPPHMFYASRQDDPLDFDYGADPEDAQKAFSGNTTDSGVVGSPIRALCPFADDFMVMGGREALWIMRGDPAAGGSIDNLSRSLGIVDQDAWSFGPSGELYFLSRNGLCVLAPGAQTEPRLISEDVIPVELKDINTEKYKVSMGYDQHLASIVICIGFRNGDTLEETVPLSSYFYHVRHKAFFPWRAQFFYPTCVHTLTNEYSRESGLLLGMVNGYISRLSRHSTIDQDSLEIGRAMLEQYVDYGPFRIGADDFIDGMLRELDIALDRQSGRVVCEIRIADTAEDTKTAPIVKARTMYNGLNQTFRPNLSGKYALIRFRGKSGRRRWSIEKAVMRTAEKGRSRRR